MLKLLFRKGLPDPHRGLCKFYVFELMLNDGTTCQAVLDETVCDTRLYWKKPNNMVIIPASTVLGWRETYNCDEARRDVDAYLKDTNSIIAKDHLDDALRRHIDREPCPYCRRYYEAKLFLVTNSYPFTGQ